MFTAGDVIHIPSESLMFKWDDSEAAPMPELRTSEKPTIGLYVKDRSDFYSVVLAAGEYWTLKRSDIYRLDKKESENVTIG